MIAKDFEPIEYQKEYEPLLLLFLEKCLPESNRCLDISGRHSYYLNIAEHFDGFWCMFDSGMIIGTVAVSKLDSASCELKSLYLSAQYQGMGYGKKLLGYAIERAKKAGYKKMFLDSLSTSTKAISLYRRFGFVDTERYNSNVYSDVFMVLEL
ncbi:MAG: GNAT family N-acetyltransferase [Ruminococcus sp.]|nr:GNAT family N-acetyltransferase [Ruminococcus sp.]